MLEKIRHKTQPIFTSNVYKDKQKVAKCHLCLDAGCINCQPLSKIFSEGIKKQKHNGLIDLFA